jgi:3-hydroxy-3-methylglutaryl CoA synthase
MIGITHYGGYIPKLRLERMQVVQAMGWFAPAIMAVAQGERSVCNWDEDTSAPPRFLTPTGRTRGS